MAGEPPPNRQALVTHGQDEPDAVFGHAIGKDPEVKATPAAPHLP